MTTLNLMHCLPDPRKLLPWAARQGWLPAGGDPGYALHIALREALGDRAPKPFYYRDVRAGLLGYSQHSADELHEAVALARPDLAAALGLNDFNMRPFPLQWSAGRMLGFEVRVRPVHRGHDKRERDALLAEIERKSGGARLNREDVYRQWLEDQFAMGGAASAVESRMTRFQLTSVMRRTRALAQGGEARKSRLIQGPDAVFTGHLRVEDPDAFARLIVRGIGRHRSFGFGMLLLRPASAC
jgi:CRISPR system Cascade subunit CasE